MNFDGYWGEILSFSEISWNITFRYQLFDWESAYSKYQ